MSIRTPMTGRVMDELRQIPRTSINSLFDLKLSSLSLSVGSADFSRTLRWSMKWCPCSKQNRVKTYYINGREQKENEMKLLILLIVDNKETMENYKDQSILTDVRIKTALNSISELDVSKTNATDIWQMTYEHFITLIVKNTATTGLLKLVVNRLMRVYGNDLHKDPSMPGSVSMGETGGGRNHYNWTTWERSRIY